MDINIGKKYLDLLISPLQEELRYLEREDDVLNFYKAHTTKKEESTHGNIISFKIFQAFDHKKNLIGRELDLEKIFKEDESIKIFYDLKKKTSCVLLTKILTVNEKLYTFLTNQESFPNQFYLRLDGSIFTTYKILSRLKKIDIYKICINTTIINAVNDYEARKLQINYCEYENNEILNDNKAENVASCRLKDSKDLVDTFKNLKIQGKNLVKDEKENKYVVEQIKKYKKMLENKNLNKSQQESLEFCRKNESYRIIGPPGSGKTKTVVKILKTLLNHKKSVLVCGPSNISVDNILSSFINSKYYKKNKPSLYKLGSFAKTSKSLSQYHLEYMSEESVASIRDELNDAIQMKYSKIKINKLRDLLRKSMQEFEQRTILTTKLAFATLFGTQKIEGKKSFDWIIIDEACQARESESFLGILLAKKFILVGDPYQLGPTVKSESPELKVTLFDRICNITTFFLNEQYRMSKLLISFSNLYFYSNRIISSQKSTFSFFNRSQILFIDTSNHQSKESKLNSSIKNIFEANITSNIIKYLESEKNVYDVGIITPYSQQAIHIKDILPKVSFSVQVSTVDAFQGQEKGIIILNFVRANKQQEIGFLSDLKRTNVALTRCVHGLIIVANSFTFAKHDFYIKLFEHLHSYAYCINPDILTTLLLKGR